MMTNDARNLLERQPPSTPSIKIFGVGGAGLNLLETLIQRGQSGVAFAALNTDAPSLARSSAAEKLHLESKVLWGLGTGGDPDRGKAAAEEHASELRSLCEGTNLAIILAGLGGGTATGAAPVLARVAKEAGALVVAFAALPFDCEGSRRRQQAAQGVEQLRAFADAVICLPNQKVFKLIDENTSVVETFKLTNEFLARGVEGVWRMLTLPGPITLHFSDLCAAVRGRHAESSFASVEASGTARAREVAEKLIAHPLLDGGEMLKEAESVLVSIQGGPDLTMAEINRVLEQIQRLCDGAQLVMGAAVDEAFQGGIAVTLIAARRNAVEWEENRLQIVDQETVASEPTAAPELESQLINPEQTERPRSRFIAPPPEATPEKVEALLSGRGRGRSRRSQRLKQAQLPLEIISKGRFDQSEPTIHKGEDLDIPTYIRRGVPLN